MIKDFDFSVVMSVYRDDVSEFVNKAFNSIINQSIPPSEVVIVIDGPVGNLLKKEIERISLNLIVNCIWLEYNVGRGVSRHQGILKAKNNIIALMDADDISDYMRFEKQISIIKEGKYNVVGGYISEFSISPKDSKMIRKVPLEHSLILKRSRLMQPMNHVTIMFDKSLYLKSGGYQNYNYIEDYDLIYRLICVNSKFINIPNTLVYVRVSKDQYIRRRGVNYFLEEVKLQTEMYRSNYISLVIYIRNILIRLILRFSPLYFFKILTRNFLRKNL